jgi:hypothetical protein
MGGLIHRLLARLRDWWAVEDPAERIEGSGDVVLDPAYNGRYTAERRLQGLARAGNEEDSDPAEHDHVDPPHLE